MGKTKKMKCKYEKKKDLCWIGTTYLIYIDRGINKEEVKKNLGFIQSIMYSVNIGGISKLESFFVIC